MHLQRSARLSARQAQHQPRQKVLGCRSLVSRFAHQATRATLRSPDSLAEKAGARLQRRQGPAGDAHQIDVARASELAAKDLQTAGSLLTSAGVLAMLGLLGDASAAAAATPEGATAAATAADAGGLAAAAMAAVTSSGWAGPAVFVALYVAATVLLFPASVLTLAAGALYGPGAGTALVSLASTTGATAAFLVSRYLARPWVEDKLKDQPRFRAVLRGVGGSGSGSGSGSSSSSSFTSSGAYVVFLLRLSPLVPFNLLNYACGLTPVGLAPYVAASWAGMLPGTFAYVYLGGAGRAAVDAAASGGASMSTSQLVLYGVGAVATVLATRAISSAASKALEEQEQGQAQEPQQSKQQHQ